LSAEETDPLREARDTEHRSMHKVAVLAIGARTAGGRRAAILDELFDTAASEDAEPCERLSQYRWFHTSN
jgi:hypothetical protein